MRPIYGTDNTFDGQMVAAWFGSLTGSPQYGPYAALGWVDDSGAIVGAALFMDYSGSSIELHAIGRMTRQMLRECFQYAFDTAGVLYLRAKPPRHQRKSRDVLERIGFVPECTMRRYYGPTRGCDAIVYRIDRRTAEKWMK